MAACSVCVPQPVHMMQYPTMSDTMLREGRRGSSVQYQIREDIIFTPPASRSGTLISSRANSESSIDTAGVNPHADRRAAVLQEYFKSTNALTRSIMLEKSTVENQHGHSWTVLSDSTRDEIVDEHFVPPEVRDMYDEHGLSRQTRSLSRLSSSPAVFSQDRDYDAIPHGKEMVASTLSQPNVKGRFTSQRAQSLTRDGTQPEFSRNKLMSYSMRSKVSPVNKRKAKLSTDVVPIFERDVNDIDNEVDLPDESLINDHIDSPESNEDSFVRLRPLRYSFGRKLRHKVEHTQSSTDLTVFSNMNIESPSFHDLSHVGMDSSLDLNETSMNISPDLLTRSDPDAIMMSPACSDDTISIASRQSMSTPDPTHMLNRGGKPLRTFDSAPFKHPLSRSVRAGSTYVTVTSDLADRRHMFKGQTKRKAKSANNTRENTPVPNEASSEEKKQIPDIKTDLVTDGPNVYFTTSSAELISPMCSPPPSPAFHGPQYSKRESGYISSYGENEASDEDEAPSRLNIKSRKRTNHILNVGNHTVTTHH